VTIVRSRLHCSLGLGMLLLFAPACEKSKAEEETKPTMAPQKAGSPAATQSAQPTISVLSATYGHSCGAAEGNHTTWVEKACAGRVACAFKVSNEHGDPSPECAKDFTVKYRCGDRPDVRKTEHGAETGENYSVQLSCQ